VAEEQPEAVEPAPQARGSRRWLLALGLTCGLGGASAAAGALGYLAPVLRPFVDLHAGPAQAMPVFHALPEFRVPLGPLSEAEARSASPAGRQLRAVVQLEIAPDHARAIAALQPRIVDTLLAFLHALRERDFANPYGLDRLKAQMLYRVRQVAGEDAVHGVLITELAVL
jgi:flagellar basal body-associated protein FliL